ncbi:GDSL-type esterase/lipase family protein [Aetokthonos hydrillicola Thurmond2011]|jgi:lysophospholipase L1-like esterase|uniref:GDSL-type esterase/lipase family protein n=1 Tax=Aetokthonos hydrillicola Thurmond2011 TaxID=2712845 RepID=A0AAP5M9H9_9CYAN|nr:GDSL-type esterase/lipase family protein [Aetokthonos hydrillicola]MBO3457610.1 carbohydrate-binding protein [Aetokthonos hydrillicola CCALA 1050]MBW4587888.1 carbohydrate-binding protein [Aetokthonos hydrillicola CCALA 1050]MDR9894708.1 GDSL-type esterase/lipase family protein [Aetokthonos hydrillicola Thurmond2011]
MTAIRIEAENYKSGQGNYYDKSAGNNGGKYRTEDVDIYASKSASNGYLVGYTEAGEWLTYDVDITQPGTYKLVAHVASAQNSSMSLSGSIGGQQKQTQFTGTGGWTNWTDVNIGTFNLNTGKQTLRVDELIGGFNIDYFELVPVNSSNVGNPGNSYNLGNIVNSRIGSNTYTGGDGIDTISYAHSPSAIVANLSTGIVTHNLPNSAEHPLKIMPVGDSITYGLAKTGDTGSYRDDLWKSLTNNGYSIDFVGPQSSGPDGFDKDHAGFPGWTITNVSDSINGWISTYKPDKVLLMIGTNDILKSDNPTQAPNRLSNLIDQILNQSPDTQVLVAAVPPVDKNYPKPGATFWQQIMDYNSQIPGIVNSKVSQGKNVTYVNINGSLQESDLTDGVHPGTNGNSKVAKTWYDSLLQSNTGTDKISNFENIVGSKYNDVITGNSGNNIIDGGGGNDILTGGGGNDTFVLRPDQGTVRITDFTIGKDILGLSNGIKFDQLVFEQGTGGNLNDGVIGYNGKTIAMLNGVQAGALTPNSFITV